MEGVGVEPDGGGSCSAAIATSVDLVARFQKRLVDELVDNNVLRGAWVEEIVAHYLPGWEFPGQWSYFDLEHRAAERTLSVKHSAGWTPRFDVIRRKWAWDNRIMGWRGHDRRPPQHWCDVYVFAWLKPPLERGRVLDAEAWRFAVIPRGSMYRLAENAKTITTNGLTELGGGSFGGDELAHRVDVALHAELPPDTPALDLTPYAEAASGALLESGAPEPVIVTEAIPLDL